MPQLRDDMTAHTRSLPAQDPSRPPRSPVTARLLERARREWARQEYEAAERSLTNALALAPDDPEATRMLGGVVLRRGKYVRAIECFRKVLPVWPDDDDLRIGLGIALYEQGEVPEAVMHLRRACELAPASASAWFNLGETRARRKPWRRCRRRWNSIPRISRPGFRWPGHRRTWDGSTRRWRDSAKCCSAIPATPKAGSDSPTSTRSASMPRISRPCSEPWRVKTCPTATGSCSVSLLRRRWKTRGTTHKPSRCSGPPMHRAAAG